MPRDADSDIQINVNVADLPDNKEDFQLIWLDAHLGESSDTVATQNLLRILNTTVQLYTDKEKCLELMQNVTTEHILLIVSGQLAGWILPQINRFRSVRAVFIFCETRELHTTLLNNYSSKVVDIFTDRNALFESISETMNLIEKQDAVFHLFDHTQKSTRDLSKESASFLWHQLLVDVLRKMPADEQAKKEMLDHCAAYYRHNKEELKKIKRFRTSYTPNDAIKYYTEESFLYKLLNKALRTEDIELLYIFRFFIIDLCAQLEVGKKQLMENEPLTVYRGQQMPKEEFENLKTKIGSLIATNGFLSTSRKEEVTIGFANSPSLREDMVQVLLTIKANPKLKTVTFADVSRQSEFQFEEEVLFSLGAVFRIDACEFDESSRIGKLMLTATDEGSETLMDFLNAEKDQLLMYSPMIYFGRLLMNEMNAIDRAATYFQTLLETLPKDHPDISEVYNQIGVLHYLRTSEYRKELDKHMLESELQKALEMFEKALEIRRNTFGNNDVRIARSMNSIGSVYNDRGEYDRALDCYQRGLQILENDNVGASVFKANLLWNCGNLKIKTIDKEAALSFYIQADEMYIRCLPIQHPTRVETALTIGNLYKSMSDFTNALIYYKRAYDSCVMMPSPSTKKFRDVWVNIIHCCLKLGDKKQATTYLNRGLKICERLSRNVEEISTDYLSIAKQFEDALDFEMALNYYKEYLRLNTEKMNIPEFEHVSEDFSERSAEERISILKFKIQTYEKLFPVNDLKYSSFLAKIGKLLDECNATDFAYQCYQKAFDILQLSTLDSSDILFDISEKLIDIRYVKIDNYSAHHYLERALKKFKQDLSEDDPSYTDFLSHIACQYEKIGDISNALHYFEEAFASAETTRSYKNILFLLNRICTRYMTNDKEQVVHSYIQRTLNIYDKDPVMMSQCYPALSNLYEVAAVSKLDELWIDFVRQRVDSLLMRIRGLCDNQPSPHHFKAAMISWIIGYFLEEIERDNIALKYYQEATVIWEELLYNRGDKRTIDALDYLLSHYFTYFDNYRFSIWLKCPVLANSATNINLDKGKNKWKYILKRHDKWQYILQRYSKWKCIVQRLKIVKMIYTDNQWKHHSLLRCCVLDGELCSIATQQMLKICTDELQGAENNASLDNHSVICCLEFISHWYFEKNQYLESLRYRQHQLELETKLFSAEHSHVAGSLWFIGLIFQKMNDYNLSLDYFTRALKIFEHLHSREHEDIQKLEEYISQTKQTTKNEEIPIQRTEIQKIKIGTKQSVPRSLRVFVHLD